MPKLWLREECPTSARPRTAHVAAGRTRSRVLHRIALLGLFACFFFMDGIRPRDAYALTKPAWSVFVYLDGDNELGTFARESFRQLTRLPDSPDLRIVVLYDGPERDDTYTFVIKHGMKLDPNAAQKLPDAPFEGEKLLSDAGTLEDFLSWGLKNHAGVRNALVVWDHGHTWFSVCSDTRHIDDKKFTGRITLMNAAIKKSLTAASVPTLDLLAFDSCLNGTVENAFEFRGVTRVFVASEENVPVTSFPYSRCEDLDLDGQCAAVGEETGIFSSLLGNPTLNEEQLASGFVQAYGRRYEDETLSAVRSAKLTGLVDRVGALSAEMIAAFANGPAADQEAIRRARRACPEFARPHWLADDIACPVLSFFDINPGFCASGQTVDLGSFCRALKSTPRFSQLCEDAITALDAAIIDRVPAGPASPTQPWPYGLSVFHPLDNASYMRRINRNKSYTPQPPPAIQAPEFATRARWHEYLQGYFAHN